MNINLLQIASIIAIFQAVLLAIVFIQNKKGTRASNYILSTVLIVFSIHTTSSLFLSFDTYRYTTKQHELFFFLEQLAFLVGPLLYLYVKALLDTNFSMKKNDWLHFLPFPTAIICAIIIIQHYDSFNVWVYQGRIYFSGIILLQNLAYFIALFKIFRSYGLTFRSFLSYIDNIQLAWVRFFIVGYIVLWSIQLQLFVSWDVLKKPDWCAYAISLYFLTAFLFFNGMVYVGLKKPEIFRQDQKYRNSVLNKSDKERYRKELISLMNQEKLYLNSSLTLTELAKKLDIAPYYVSQILNETFHQNFRDFINKYRIEESKRLLTQQNQNLNIMGIALNTGFNSKSAFNSAFKKNTGITPKEFKRKTSSIVTL